MSDDPRLGDLLAKHSEHQCGADGVALVFFPHDEGVRRNGGRVGSKHGPNVFMEHVRRTGTLQNLEFGADLSHIQLVTVGAWVADATETISSLEESHELLTQQVAGVLAAGGLPFVVGGGNDQSYPNVRALLQHVAGSDRPVACVNIDAHLDVRPLKLGKVHSGSPFRLLLEDSRFDPKLFCEFAAQGHQCSGEHARYALDRGAQIKWLSELKKTSDGPATAFRQLLESWPSNAAIFVSFDLDAICGRDAPGVSCPSPVGLSAEDAHEICRIAGEHPNVALFDLSEFNPTIEAYRTGKLVASLFYMFLLGYSKRLEKKKKIQPEL